ncbi:MAG: MFS transporter [Eggerthellaceae bacterium]|nr:MFS transporter [Eggerthellaceae bacterium]
MAKLEKGDSGYKRTIALIVALGSAPPIATDLFLPALPQMTEVLNASESIVGFTLSGFFLFMAAGTLAFGPISDKFGRKRPLLVAGLMFAIFGLLSGLVSNVWLLIAARVLQGIGGGGMVAISMALVKDCFDGRTREKVLVIIQAMGVIAPMCAPLLGSIILTFADWRFTFFMQAFLGFACLVLIVLTPEPLDESDRTTEGVVRSIGRLFVVGRNKAFLFILLTVVIHGAPYMGYISCASYIYIDFFELSTFQYSAFFAANAALSVVGAGLALVVSGRVQVKGILMAVFAVSLVAGVGLVVIGYASPFAFLILFGTYALMGSVSRPFVMNILLEQQDGDTGSASSLINFTFNIGGTFGMVLATMPWPNYVMGLGVLVTVVSVVALVAWNVLLRSNIKIRGIE